MTFSLKDRVDEVLTLWQEEKSSLVPPSLSMATTDNQFNKDLCAAITSRRGALFGFEKDSFIPPPHKASPRHMAALRALAQKTFVFLLLCCAPLWVIAQDKPAPVAVQKSKITATVADKVPVDTTACGGKKYCKDMVSCEEAKMYLTKCNLTRLDKNKDGIPCESLCKKQ